MDSTVALVSCGTLTTADRGACVCTTQHGEREKGERRKRGGREWEQEREREREIERGREGESPSPSEGRARAPLDVIVATPPLLPLSFREDYPQGISDLPLESAALCV